MIARIWTDYCADDEWGNETMARIARERFEKDHTIDIVEVSEHAGWHLSFNRDGLVVGTANDVVVWSDEVKTWRRQFKDGVRVGHCRRTNGIDQRDDNYFPAIAQVA